MSCRVMKISCIVDWKLVLPAMLYMVLNLDLQKTTNRFNNDFVYLLYYTVILFAVSILQAIFES